MQHSALADLAIDEGQQHGALAIQPGVSAGLAIDEGQQHIALAELLTASGFQHSLTVFQDGFQTDWLGFVSDRTKLPGSLGAFLTKSLTLINGFTGVFGCRQGFGICGEGGIAQARVAVALCEASL